MANGTQHDNATTHSQWLLRLFYSMYTSGTANKPTVINYRMGFQLYCSSSWLSGPQYFSSGYLLNVSKNSSIANFIPPHLDKQHKHLINHYNADGPTCAAIWWMVTSLENGQQMQNILLQTLADRVICPALSDSNNINLQVLRHVLLPSWYHCAENPLCPTSPICHSEQGH